MNLRGFLELLKATFSEWSKDNASRLAAALAYYTTFSLAPLLVIVIGIAGLVASRFGQQNVQKIVLDQVQGMIGPKAADLVQTMIGSALKPSSSILATIIGVVILLFGATGLFAQLQAALNTVWDVTPKPGRGVLAMVKDRLLSFAMVLGVGFLLLLSLAVSTALTAVSNYFGGVVPDLISAGQVLNPLISFIVVTLLFGMIYKFLPDAEISWGDVWIGAGVTSLLFNIGKFLIGLYLGKSSVASVYGVAGSLAVLLIWIYYSAQIVLLGAEFTQVYAKKYGSRIVPDDYAVSVTAHRPAKEEEYPPEEFAGEEERPLLEERPVAKLSAPEITPEYKEPLQREVLKLKRERLIAVLLGLAMGLLFTKIGRG